MKRTSYVALILALLTACQVNRETQRDLPEEILSNDLFKYTRELAREVVRSGFSAGDGYDEVWIRDYNTFIEVASTVFEPERLKEQILVFFRMQGPDGNIVDGFVPRDQAVLNYDYLYFDAEPRYAGHKNTVETDQESSLVQTVYKYIKSTGDRSILEEEVEGVRVAERLESAMRFLMEQRYDRDYGLIWGATTTDWGDVQPEHEWGVFLTEDSHYAIDIYDNAMFLIALDNVMELVEGSRARWKPVRDAIANNVRKHLWDEEGQKFVPHLYLDDSPFPEDFNEEAIYYHGGTAVAIEAGLLSREEVARSLNRMVENVEAIGAGSIGLTLYPAYPDGFFKNPSMHAYGYQNGGDWTWFGARMIRQLVEYGFMEEAYDQLLPMVQRVYDNQGFYEWYTVQNEARGSGTFRGSAGVLYTAIRGLEKWAANQQPDPNVVLIMVDDMGYGDLASYNPDSKIPTPHIDQIARSGMRFTDAHAAGSLCHPSRYGLLTGRYPFRTDLSVWRKQATIGKEQTTLASMLRSRGYATAMVGKWHLGFDESGYDQPLPGGPVDRGFDSYFGIRASTDIPPYFYIRGREAVAPPTDSIGDNFSEGWSPIQGAFWRAGGIAPGLQLSEVLPRFTDEALQVIHEHHPAGQGDKPLFLYLAYPAPHTPWLPGPEFEGRSGAGMYGDFLMMVDQEVGRVLEALEDQGMASNTLLIFTSDNGPVWYEDDVKRFAHDASGGWRGMKGDAWEAGHRMPFMVRWPGRVEDGSVSAHTLSFTDVMATLAAATGKPMPEGAGPDSYSFLPVLLGQPGQEPRPPLFLRSANKTMVVRDGPWKLIDGLGSGGFSKPGRVEPGPGDPPGQLYDLSVDPGETQNLWLEEPEVVSRLQEYLKSIQ